MNDRNLFQDNLIKESRHHINELKEYYCDHFNIIYNEVKIHNKEKIILKSYESFKRLDNHIYILYQIHLKNDTIQYDINYDTQGYYLTSSNSHTTNKKYESILQCLMNEKATQHIILPLFHNIMNKKLTNYIKTTTKN